MLDEFFEGLADSYSKEHELAAIWLEKPLQTATEKTVRIAPDHLVKVEDGNLVDCIGEPTHKVIGCYGTVTSSKLSFLLIDLQTNQPIEIKVQ
jgi:hypothetical protein